MDPYREMVRQTEAESGEGGTPETRQRYRETQERQEERMRQKKMGRQERPGETDAKRQEGNRKGKYQVRERGREKRERPKGGTGDDGQQARIETEGYRQREIL